jgi:hypothetical protein
MGATDVIIAVVLVLMLAEAVRGLVKWRSGGLEAFFGGLAGAVPCISYLISQHVSESFGLAFVVVGSTVAWSGLWAASRRNRSARSGGGRPPAGNEKPV